jgi:hypothetical protein
MNFNRFKNEWLGKRVDWDKVYSYQCVDLILQYVYECYGITGGVSGNAIDYWVKTGNNGFNTNLLSKFDKITSNEAREGDIVILNGLAGNPYGHIGVATGSVNAAELEILEQNGQDGSGNGEGGNTIRVRYVARNRVAGLLRPKVPVSNPAPAPSVPNGDNVHLPASVQSWAIYRVGSQLRKGTSDQVGSLAPARFGGLTYKIQSWVGNYAVVISTQDFGQVALWVKDTVAGFTNSAPAAPAPPVIVHPYTIETIPEKQIKINKQTHRWNLNYDNLTAMVSHPENTANTGDIKSVRAIAHHNIGYNYLLENPDVASGYNVVDCDDYTAPPPPPAPPVPNPIPPAAPLTLPSSETYDLVKELDGYITSNQAVNHINPKVKIASGTYFVFNKRFRTDDPAKLWALNLTKTPGKPGAWINTADNVITPEPEVVDEPEEIPPAGVTYKEFSQPQKYVVTADCSLFDLATDEVVAIYHKFDEIWVEGAAKKDGIAYARLASEEADEWLAVRVYAPTSKLPNLELYNKVYAKDTTVADRAETKNVHLIDHLALSFVHARKNLLAFVGLFSKIKSVAKK